MPDQKRKGVSSSTVQKRSSPTGPLLAIVAVLVLIGAAVAFTRPAASAPAAPATAAAVTAKATAAPVSAAGPTAPASAPTGLPTAATVAQAPATQASATQASAAPSTNGLTFGGSALTLVTAQDGVVKLPVADVSDGKAHFYAFKGSSKIIPFFVLKSSDGVIRAAFDACDVCFAAKKGYHQEGDEMVCNNCGSRFPSAKINEVKGGCNPSPLTRQVQGDSVIIQVTDIQAGASYF